MDTRADGGDVSGRRLLGDDCGLRSDGCGLVGDIGGSGRLAGDSSDNAQGVGLLQERSLGVGVDGLGGLLDDDLMADPKVGQELTVSAETED